MSSPPPAPEPSTSPIGDPWSLLRSAGAVLDPTVEALRQRVESTEGTEWLAGILAGRWENTPTAQLVVAAMHSTEVLERDPAAFRALPQSAILAETWSIVTEHAPQPFADRATRALLLADRSGVVGGTSRPAPLRVGKYDLLRLIGTGGTGAVYEARHRDNGLPGAVKLLRLDAWDLAQVERFRREARIIASLEHPSIVRLLDSGVEELGGVAVPYLVSELVRGRPFAVATSGWPIPALLRAFAAVCAAVAHAHERGVLHRDLKSPNVLVDDSGLPHLLDFGIARMTEVGARNTQSGMLLGTPSAMSPEQAASGAVDACSEVWSLGAMLFEALAGTSPHDLRGLVGTAVLRRIAEYPPRRLGALRADLPKDLLAVVGKAIAIDRRQRYPNVQALLDDVHRLAAGDPVAARPSSAWRTFTYLARRHRLLSSALAIAATSVVGGGITAAMFWWQAETARHESLAAMERTLGFAGRLVEMATPSTELHRLLTEALGPLAGQDLDTADEARLRVESRLREYLGDLEHRIGDAAAARRHRLRVRDVEVQLRRRGDGDRSDLARALIKLGDLDRVADPEGAHAAFAEAHTLLAGAAAAPHGTVAQVDDLGWSHERMAVEAIRLRRWDEAHAQLKARIALAKVLLQRQSDGLRHFGLASGLSTLADAIQIAPAQAPDPSALPTVLQEARAEIAKAIAADPQRIAFLQLGISLNARSAELAVQTADAQAAASCLECLAPWLDTLLTAGAPVEAPVLATIRAIEALGIHEASAGHPELAKRHFDAIESLAAKGEAAALRSRSAPTAIAAFRRAAWLAVLRDGDPAKLERHATGLLAVVEHLQDAPQSVDALVQLALWVARADQPRARDLLAKARGQWQALPTGTEGASELEQALATAEAACGVVPPAKSSELAPIDSHRR